MDNDEFGKYFKGLLMKNGLSMGQFSKISGIDKATISRIANNKQKPNIKHLEKISENLNVEMEMLLEKLGYDNDKKENNVNYPNGEEYEFNDFNDILEISNLIKDDKLIKNIEKKLGQCEQYIQTDEGKNLLDNSIEEKINSVSGNSQFINKIKEMYEIFSSQKLSFKEYILIGSALLYFVISIDIIPDFIFPIGFLDDIIAINIVVKMIQKKIYK